MPFAEELIPCPQPLPLDPVAQLPGKVVRKVKRYRAPAI